MNKIAKIIAENWDETWKIVWQRAQATQTIERQYNGLTGNHHHPESSIRWDCGKIEGESPVST